MENETLDLEGSIGVFLHLEDPHGIFPSRAPHDESPPHLTILSGLKAEGDFEIVDGIREIIAQYPGPHRLRARRFSEFTMPEFRVFYLVPEFENSRLFACRDELHTFLVSRGKTFSFMERWNPHITWEYIVDDRQLPGDVDYAFTGELEVWGYSKP